MIKASNGRVEAMGHVREVKTEFMAIAEALRSNGVYHDKDEMIDAIKFVWLDDEGRDKVLKERRDKALKALKDTDFDSMFDEFLNKLKEELE